MEAQGAGSLDGVAISEVAPPFGCDSEPATLPFDCEATLALAPGESRVHRVTVIIPDDGRFDNADNGVDGQNCVAVIAPGAIPIRAGGQALAGTPGNLDMASASACHPFTDREEAGRKQCSGGFVIERRRPLRLPGGNDAPQRAMLAGRRRAEAVHVAARPDQDFGRTLRLPEGTLLGANGCYTPPRRPGMQAVAGHDPDRKRQVHLSEAAPSCRTAPAARSSSRRPGSASCCRA